MVGRTARTLPLAAVSVGRAHRGWQARRDLKQNRSWQARRDLKQNRGWQARNDLKIAPTRGWQSQRE